MTMECSLLFVSRVTIDHARREQEIAAIAASARVNNAKEGITGGLVRSSNAFAQLIEGSNAAIDDMMRRIERDPRHCDIRVLRVSPRTSRRLSSWSMAYNGEWQFTTRHIDPLFVPGMPDESEKIDRLERLIVAFASAQ